MAVQLRQAARMGAYLMTQRLRGIEKYPLIVELEPLFQCNLACEGCGKIQHPEHELRRRMPVDQAVNAVLECGAPMVSIAGGEPLIHPEIDEIVRQLVKRKKFVYLCTNAILLAKHIDEYQPSKYLTFSIHLDGNKERHDESVCLEGVYDKAVAAIRLARAKGFRVTINCTLFSGENPDEVAEFFDTSMKLGIEGITVSPGFSYEHAPRQDVFLGRSASKRLFREVFKRRKQANTPDGSKRAWTFNHSSLFLDFLAGNQTYACTPWSNPTYNVFGWQRPCYLLSDEGYAPTYKSLIADTEWHKYGIGNNAKCNNCMAHCGFEGTAVNDAFRHPLKALLTALRGPRISGPMAPDLALNLEHGAAPAAATEIMIPVAAIKRPERKIEGDLL